MTKTMHLLDYKEYALALNSLTLVESPCPTCGKVYGVVTAEGTEIARGFVTAMRASDAALDAIGFKWTDAHVSAARAWFAAQTP